MRIKPECVRCTESKRAAAASARGRAHNPPTDRNVPTKKKVSFAKTNKQRSKHHIEAFVPFDIPTNCFSFVTRQPERNGKKQAILELTKLSFAIRSA